MPRAAWLTLGLAALLAALLPSVAHATPFDDACPPGLSRTTTAWTCADPAFTVVRSPGPDDPDVAATCRAEGLDLRADDLDAATADALCTALRRDPPALFAAPRVRPPDQPPWPRTPATTALAALAGVWALLALATLRDRRAWVWIVAAGAVRAALAPAGVFMGLAYPFERMLILSGHHGASALYGGAWAGWGQALRAVGITAVDAVFTVQLVLSSAIAGWLWTAVRDATDDPRAAHAAAAAWVVAPHAIALAATETMFGWGAALVATLLVGLARRDRLGDALTVAAVVCLGHLRPMLMLPGLVAVGALLARRRCLWATVAVAGLAVRGVEIGALVQDEGIPTGANRWPGLLGLARNAVGDDGAVSLLDPTVTPGWIAVGVLAALIHAARTKAARPAVVIGTALALTLALPYAHMHRVTDVLRFQLPALVAWTAVAAVAVPPLWPHLKRPVIGGVAALVVVHGLVLASAPRGGTMLHQAAFLAAREAFADLPPGTVVHYDPARDPDGTWPRWEVLATGIVLTPLPSPPPRTPFWYWHGRGDSTHAEPSLPGCTWEGDLAPVPTWTGHLWTPARPPQVGLLRVTACAAP